MSQWVEHLIRTLGQPEPLSWQEIVFGQPEIKIHIVRLPDENATVLVTEGMSSRPMKVPDGMEEFRYAELACWLRDDWPLDEESLRKPEFFWPMQWLRKCALYPHHNETWLGGPFTIMANDDPPLPLGPGTELSCLLLLASYHPYGKWQRTDGQHVVVYDVLPIYTEERNLERNEGLAALLDRLQEYAISPTLHPRRVNVGLIDDQSNDTEH
ncbi:MAG: suppressor of fused domain protein [Planctomyces sp.]|nr:suppressor of fused domain protein [Planctomyces sp.]